MVDEISSNQLTAKKSDFSEWYQQTMLLADILDQRYDLKGMFVWKGYGFKAMNNIRKMWDELFEKNGIEETYFPLIIPINYCKQNESWWEKFSEEGYKVIAGKDNQIQGALRPTGEPAMYPMFSLWVRSKSDLPIRLYENTSSFRYETKSTRPLIRDVEITVWHEIHTAHATKQEADKEIKLHIKMWDQIWKNLCLPTWKIDKPEWECFPGAVGGVEYYNTMPSAKVLETGSVNNLGQAYAKKFNIKFTDENNSENHVWQVCTGVGARLLAAALAIHGDDRGLIMPPKIAPISVVILPIVFKGKEDVVNKKCEDIYKKLKNKISTKYDAREISIGKKFYDWELKGVPIRLEIGPRDIEKEQVTIVRRDTFEKREVKESDLLKELKKTFSDIEDNLLKKATDMLQSQMIIAKDSSEIKKSLSQSKICKVPWCGNKECFDIANALEPGSEALGSSLQKLDGNCFNCNKKSSKELYVAKCY